MSRKRSRKEDNRIKLFPQFNKIKCTQTQLLVLDADGGEEEEEGKFIQIVYSLFYRESSQK